MHILYSRTGYRRPPSVRRPFGDRSAIRHYVSESPKTICIGIFGWSYIFVEGSSVHSKAVSLVNDVFGKHILCSFLIPSLIFRTASLVVRTAEPTAPIGQWHRMRIIFELTGFLFLQRLLDYPDSLSFNGHLTREHSRARTSLGH